ncbi:MAG: EAL domain-containing protein [Actinomycetota bacterium]|nr:EAL domain-containing protein [Actinomycetota bacterium]
MVDPLDPLRAGPRPIDTLHTLHSLQALAAAAIDVVYESDEEGLIQWISPSLTQVLGWAPPDIVGTRLMDLAHPDDVAGFLNAQALVYSQVQPVAVGPVRLLGSSGEYRGLSARARPITGDDGVVEGAIVTLADTSLYDAAVRALTTLSECNRALVRAVDEHGLHQAICDIIVASGEYAFSWYGIPVNDTAQSVRPIAATAAEAGYLDDVTISWGDNSYGHGPTGECLRTGMPQVRNVLEDDLGYQPWQEAAARHGFRASISLPVVVRGDIDGALMVYATDPHAFDDVARTLMSVLAADLGFGLERLRSLDEVIRQRSRLQGAMQSQFDPFVLLESVRDGTGAIVDFRYLEASDAAIAFDGGAREQMAGRMLKELVPDDGSDPSFASFVRVAETGEPLIADDLVYLPPDGAAPRRLDIRAVRSGDGVAVSFRDVTERFEVASRLALSEERYRLLAENSSDVILLSDHEANVEWVSASITNTLGWRPDDVMGRAAAEFIHPEDVPMMRQVVSDSFRTGASTRMRYRWRIANDGYRWVEAAGRPFLNESTGAWSRVVRLRDIHEQVLAEHELAEREEHYRLLAENASDVVWQVHPDGTVAWTSESVSRVLGWHRADVIGRTAMSLVAPDDVPRMTRIRDEAIGGLTSHGEIRLLAADGSTRWISITLRPVPTAEGVARVAAIRDIDAEVQVRTEAEFALGHDHVTGLPTLQVVERRIDQSLVGLGAEDEMGVLCVGLDGLGRINDALTYSAGDLMLTTVGARIAETVGSPDLVGRGAGDEFIVVIPSLASAADAGRLAEQIRVAVKQPLPAVEGGLTPTVSIGIATGRRGSDAMRLLGDASVALRQAKVSGRDRFAFVDEEVAAEAQARLSTETRIRAGLAKGEFQAWWQPIVRIATGEVAGYEALARWIHDGEVLAPSDFLPVAERSDLIHGIDITVLERAVAALHQLPEPLFASINVSSQTLAQTPYADTVEGLLAGAGTDPGRLHIEVTETTLLSARPAVVDSMRRLAALGVNWYVDDFGTGYSSISHLHDLPISGLKLDLSFTRGIRDGDASSVKLAGGLASLAKALGTDTVAEGIETSMEAEILLAQGWTYGQGWLYGRPAPLP